MIAEIAVAAGRQPAEHMLARAGRRAGKSDHALCVSRWPRSYSDRTAAEITQAGTQFLTELGIDLSALSSKRRHFCRLCIDWTERRPHIAGPVGAALTKRCFDLGWTERMKHSSAVIVTASGKHGFLETFGIGVAEETGNGIGGE